MSPVYTNFITPPTHSMTIGKSKETTPTTTTTLKDHFPQKNKIPSFGPDFIKFSKTVCCEVNLAAQSSHSEVLLLDKF